MTVILYPGLNEMKRFSYHWNQKPWKLMVTLLHGLWYWKQIVHNQALCNSHDATKLFLPILHHCPQSNLSYLLCSYKLWQFFAHQVPQFSVILLALNCSASLAQQQAICSCSLWSDRDPLMKQHVCWFCPKSHRSIKHYLHMFRVHCNLWVHTVLKSVEKKTNKTKNF